MMEFDGLEVSLDGYVAQLQLARPDSLNAFDEALHHSFTEALRYLQSQEQVRCIVISAQGKIFSAGGSYDFIERLAASTENRRDMYDDAMGVFTALTHSPVPIVTAMHGHAMGLGATIVTASDIVVAHREATLADPHVQVGLCAGDGGVASWALAAGITRAKRYLLTGDPVTAEQAYAWGLITDLVDEREAVVETARGIAGKIASLPPRAVRGTKVAFASLARDLGQAAAELSLVNEISCLGTTDLHEAIAAAREKRPGQYKGY